MIHAWRRRRFSEYLDGTLVGRARTRIEKHLARCEGCRSELAELRGTVLLLRSLPASEEAPADEFLATRVVARIAAGDAAPTLGDRARDAISTALSGAWTPAFGAVAVLFVVATVLDMHVEVTLPGAEARAPTPVAAAPALQPQFVSLRPHIELMPPVRSRRRFDPVVLEEVSGVHRACAARPHDAECQAFRNNLVELALASPPEFVREIESVPLESRERVLTAISLEAARTGHAQRVIRGLRRVDDPRAFGIVVSFQRTIASRE
jgi:hypothetical protein